MIYDVSMKGMSIIDVSIITVGYKSQSTLPSLLKSVYQQQDCSMEFIYIENSPNFSSSLIVKQHYPGAIIIEPGENLGFSKSCNLGAKKARGQYLLFLNPDCEIKTEDTLINMLKFMKAHPEVGICGPNITNHVGQSQNSEHASYFGEQYLSNKFTLLPGKVAWISGASLMIQQQLFQSINGFDERYFMYSEDVDICLNVRKKGFIIAKAPNTNVMHLGGVSSGKIWTNIENIYQMELSFGIFTSKNYPFHQHIFIWKKHKLKRIRAVIRHLLSFKWALLDSDLLMLKAAEIAFKIGKEDAT